MRLYTLPGQFARGKYMLDLSRKVVEFYERTFDCEFPLPKLDHVAVPGHLGAMENWGLIIYEASYLLVDDNTPISLKQSCTRVFMHEVAHQWFGNIVTMRFWDGLWLNEAFAEWTAWHCCNHFFSEWKPWETFLTSVFKKGLDADSLRNSHPIEVPILDSSLIGQIFDPVTYSKGSSIVRMMADSLGQDVFLKGVRAYIKEHSYSNTDTRDLWAALSKASGTDVESAMRIWTKRTGYPVLKVKEINDGVTVRQDRFLASGPPGEADNRTIFPMSVSLRTEAEVRKVALNSRDLFIPLNEPEYLVVNAERYGFYRTLYSTKLLTKIQTAIR